MINTSNNKGNWEFSFFQKHYDPIGESNIKLLLTPENGFNPKNMYNYTHNDISKEEKLILKKNNGEKLKNSELIIVKNYIDKKIENIKNDIKLIKLYGTNAKPTTKEGRTRLLLENLDLQLQKNNKENIVSIYLKLMEDKFELTEEIKKDYDRQLTYMNKIVEDTDIIELQFTKFHSQMPPLNDKGFKKFDEWQLQVINNIDNEISTVINAPTSAGKSVLSGYVITKGKILYIVPTDALAWQMASYIENILDAHVPILTETYQSHPSRDNMIELLNKSNAIVGTANIIVDYLPFIKNNFKWIVCDEIHMIGRPEGSPMEYIIKLLDNSLILALSATIGNADYLLSWLQNINPNKKIIKIICDKRFFNLQKYYYDQDKDELISIHPLSMIEENEFQDKTILNKNINPTPPTTWDLYQKLKEYFDLNELDPYKYFDISKRIELDESYKYFYKLLNFMVDKYHTNYNDKIMEIINKYKKNELNECKIDIVKLAFNLKKNNKTPTIIFHKNTVACLKMVYEFAKNVDELENKTYPKLFQERIRQMKSIKRNDKKIETSSNDNKKTLKLFLENKDKNDKNDISLQEPHEDFIFNNNQYFSESTINTLGNTLKMFFPNTGEYYHFIIKLLWRGVGIYAKGLPDPYLRLVQSLASQKQLAIVFSDLSLVFGISMPFRSVVIIKDNKYKDDLDSMIFHQMIGRAGRRGLDKEGNIIFAGFNWNRIKELSTSQHPNIIGINDILYSIPHANRLSEIFNTQQKWENTCINILDKDNEDTNSMLSILNNNYNNNWDFGYINNNVNHLYMNWQFRHSDEGLIISFLLPFIKKGFENKDHTTEINQINLAHFLLRFISIKYTNILEDVMETPELLDETPFNTILDQLDNLHFNISKNIDNKLLLSIQNNSIVKNDSEDLNNELRQRLFYFGNQLKKIQHYCFYSKITGLSKIMGKLLTRIWWIYHSSSPIMKSLNEYDLTE